MVAVGSSNVWKINGQSSNTKCLRKKRLCLWYKDDVYDRAVSCTTKYSCCAGGRDNPGLPDKESLLCYGTDIQAILHKRLVILELSSSRVWAESSGEMEGGVAHPGSELRVIPEWKV